MSKVLVDRELLEKWADKLEGADSAGYGWEDLLAAEVRGTIAQPAEAEVASIPLTGEYHIDCGYLMNLVDDQRAALSAVTAERDRLLQELAKSETNTMALMVKHFAGSMTSREQDRKLDECLSEGIAMLEAERDQYRAEVERLNAELLGRPWVC